MVKKSMVKKHEKILFACYGRPLTKNEIKTYTGYTRPFEKKSNVINEYITDGYLKLDGKKEYRGQLYDKYTTTSKIFIDEIEEQLKALNVGEEQTLSDDEKKILDYFLDKSKQDTIKMDNSADVSANIFGELVNLIAYKKVQKQTKWEKEKFVEEYELSNPESANVESMLQLLCVVSTNAFIDKTFSFATIGYDPSHFGEFKKRYKKAVKNSLLLKDMFKNPIKNFDGVDKRKKRSMGDRFANVHKKLLITLLPDSIKNFDEGYKNFKKSPMYNISNIMSYSFPGKLLEKLSNISDIGYYPKILFINNFMEFFTYMCFYEKYPKNFPEPLNSILYEMQLIKKEMKDLRS